MSDSTKVKTIDFSLSSTIGDGKITAFNYSHSLNELVGSWSAEVANGSFSAGDDFSISGVMQGGIISNAYKDADGLWHLEGKDAGYKLMKSLPETDSLSNATNAKSFINSLVGDCGITLVMDERDGLGYDLVQSGEGYFEIRSLVSGSTYTEAILEVAMFSGCVAYIDEKGQLQVKKPQSFDVSKDLKGVKDNNGKNIIINDSGSSIDLDGYATHVVVQASYPAVPPVEDEEEDEPIEEGEDLPENTYIETYSGSFNDDDPDAEDDGDGGKYSMKVLMPLDVIKELKTELHHKDDEGNELKVVTTEKHDYEVYNKTLWREEQEFGLYAFIETEYTVTREVTGTYITSSGKKLTFTEKTVEEMERTLSTDKLEVGVPDDWIDDTAHQIKMLGKDTITRTTTRTGGKEVQEGMPDYAPEFDSKIVRKYATRDWGRGLFCTEVEGTYEARQVGSIAPVKKDGEVIPHFFFDTNLAIQTHSSPEWVLVKTVRTYFDQYDNEGNCIVSTQSEYSDDGAEWLSQHALTETGDDDADEYQKAYAKFSQSSHGLQVNMGSSSINIPWQFVEIRGHHKFKASKKDAIGDNPEWYDNGEYVYSSDCPHYNTDSLSCNVFMFGKNTSDTGCIKGLWKKGYHGYNSWRNCTRAIEALDYAREHIVAAIDAPVIGTDSLSANSTAVGYKRDVYIDPYTPDIDGKPQSKKPNAQKVANILAKNILSVKGDKGFRKTITIPYNSDYQPNGDIVEVSHDWANLQTSITYRTASSDSGSSSIPDYMISQSVSAIAEFVAARNTSRQAVPKYGVISKVYEAKSTNATEKEKAKKGIVDVVVDNSTVECTSKIRGLQANSIVLVTFPAGNRITGQVIAKL